VAQKIIRLEQDTIVEATFEMRFQSTNQSASDLLPGILFTEFKGRFPKSLRTVTSNIPRQIQHADPELRYAPRQGIANEQFQVLMGDFSIQISNRLPYIGWARFKPTILDVLGALQRSELIKGIERFSLKYLNLVRGRGIQEQLSYVRLKAQLGEHDLTTLLTMIRTEIHKNGLLNIVEIAPTTKVKVQKDAELEGVMVSVDTIHASPNEFWANRDNLLEAAHDMEKEIFFGILTEDTIARLKPTYG